MSILLLSRSTTRQVRRSTLESVNALYEWQFSTVTEGLEQGTILLEAPVLDQQYIVKYFTRELIFLLAKLLTSTYADSFILRIPRYALASINYNQKLRRWLFSVTPNRRFLRMLACDTAQSPDRIIQTYSLIFSDRS
jgi:hypothetical protein